MVYLDLTQGRDPLDRIPPERRDHASPRPGPAPHGKSSGSSGGSSDGSASDSGSNQGSGGNSVGGSGASAGDSSSRPRGGDDPGDGQQRRPRPVRRRGLAARVAAMTATTMMRAGGTARGTTTTKTKTTRTGTGTGTDDGRWRGRPGTVAVRPARPRQARRPRPFRRHHQPPGPGRHRLRLVRHAGRGGPRDHRPADPARHDAGRLTAPGDPLVRDPDRRRGRHRRGARLRSRPAHLGSAPPGTRPGARQPPAPALAGSRRLPGRRRWPSSWHG